MLALVGAASLTLAGCGVSMGGDAPLATVTLGSEQVAEISQSDASNVLDEITSSERFFQAVYNGTLSTADQQNVVTQLIEREIYKAEAERRGLTARAEDLESANTLLETQLQAVASSVDPGDPEVAAAEIREELGAYFDAIAEGVAYESVLRESFAGDVEGGLPCTSHILVDDEAVSNDLIDQLNAGADFAALAQEFSIDAGSGANGGALGCVDPQGYVPEFRDAVIAAEVDDIVGPVQTDFGYHIIVVTGYEDPAAIEADFSAIFDDVVVAIDPEFGTWDAELNPPKVVDFAAP